MISIRRFTFVASYLTLLLCVLLTQRLVFAQGFTLNSLVSENDQFANVTPISPGNGNSVGAIDRGNSDN